MKKYLLFDLDGTLTDPKTGITRSVQYALSAFGIEEPNPDVLEPFIGPPLKDSFMRFYHMDSETAEAAIGKYRERFGDVGIFENEIYAGVRNMLASLRCGGMRLAVASSKPTVYVERILEHFYIRSYFEVVVGSELDGRRTDKAEVVEEALRRLFGDETADRDQVYMIGDRRYDVEGAHALGIEAVAVTYGYGGMEELKGARADYIVRSVEELSELLEREVRERNGERSVRSAKFSLLVVCLNAGEKLLRSVESGLRQDYDNFEIIVKDGGSTDGSLERLPSDRQSGGRVRVFREPDSGIYDAMNQAVSHANGDYVFFLNCGDSFRDERVLSRVAGICEEMRPAGEETCERLILYGDVYNEKKQVTDFSPPRITGLTCYRNIPCHQACFYDIRLCREKVFDLSYRVRADYEHFLWCFYRGGAQIRHVGFAVANYEGGGFSETEENRRQNRQEHREITRKYMDRGELLRYRIFMLATLAPLRTALADSRIFAGFYHGVKRLLYGGGRRAKS